ncbi:hypothetical protein MSG28_001228 [Choristoneura fumiferana]|uniref:Uncharacterized protein n=2 Tax=Choristoneura fumiferana TaxID=7141 RepID=A0ACC0K488_CHOFU|nr:hypothetical protein MSG28_001228 [Choristoneura fumiferana]
MIDEKEVIYRPRQKYDSSEVNASDFKINKVVKYSDDGYALNTYIFETSRDKFVETKEEQCVRRGKEKISIVITQKTNEQQKKEQIPKREESIQRCRKYDTRPCSISTGEYLKILAKNCSTPDVNKAYVNRKQKKKSSCSDTHINKITPIDTKFIVNTVTLEPHTIPPNCHDLLKHPLMQAQMRIYRCQLGSHEEKYCQACNSDAFFDVLKGLYDCYANKNCVNCNCILCGSLHKAKRKLFSGEVSRSKVSVGVETVATKHKTKETLKKSKDYGLFTSLNGKPTEIKESKIATISKDPLSTQLEKLRKAQASGILPTLEGYSSTQREKTNNALIQSGSPLNARKKTPDNKVINQVRKELGLPLEVRRVLQNERDPKNIILGHTALFEKKSQKETILRAVAEKRMQPQKARPTIELKKMPLDTRAQSEKLRKAREVDLLTPNEILEYKVLEFPDNEQQEICLEDEKTFSERKLIDKIRKELGLTTPITKSALAKMIKPIMSRSLLLCPSPEGLEKRRKSHDKKSKTTKEGKGDLQMCSFSTPQGSKKSESKNASPCRITFETVKASETAGLFSQLQGKTQTEKEKVIRSLANQEIPFPEAKTPSEKKIAKKIRAQLGLPPEPSTKCTQTAKSEKNKAQSLITQAEIKAIDQKKKNRCNMEALENNTPYNNDINRKVKSASVITPLKGETPEQKALRMRKLKASSSKLAEERTPSDKSHAQRMTISKTKGLVITPERKCQYDKEKMLRRLAKSGLPLPQGRTASDKELIRKIRTETVLPLETITPSLKDKLSVPRTICNRVPLESKISIQAENIIKRMSDTRIQRVQCDSPKEKSKSVRSIKTGTGHVRKSKGIVTQSVAVIKEDSEEKDKIKGTCEMGCGCNKKKIRFKHSYVKIRVTSPDTSSFCSCPYDCPGMSSGVFADNDGIKVTVETATGSPSYKVQRVTPSKQTLLQYPVSKHSEEEFHDFASSQSHISLEISSVDSDYTTDYSSSTSIVYIYNSESDVSISDIKRLLRESIDSGDFDESIRDYRQRDKPVSYIYQSRFAISRADIQHNYNQTAQLTCPDADSCSGSFYSIETVSSSAVTDSNYIRDTLSFLSTLARNLGFSTDSFLFQRSVNEEYYDTEYTESLVKETDLVPVDTLLRNSRYLADSSQESQQQNFEEDVTIYRQSLQPFRSKSLKLQQDTRRCPALAKKNVISSTRITGSSSIFIMVSTSGIDQPYSDQYLETMSKSQSSQNIISKARAWMDTKKMKLSRFDIFNRKRSYLKKGKQKSFSGEHGFKKSIHACAKAAHKMAMKCQASAGKMKDQRSRQALSMDTARDRLRYCTTDEPSESKLNVVSEIIQPMIAREKVAQGLIKDAYMKMEYHDIPSSTCYPSDSMITMGGYMTPAEHSGYSMKPDGSSQRENSIYNQHYGDNVDSVDGDNLVQYPAEPDMLPANSEVSLASTIFSSIGARSRGCVNPALYTARRHTKKCSEDCKSQRPVKKAKSCVCEDSLNLDLSNINPPTCLSKKRIPKGEDSNFSKKKHPRADDVDSRSDKILNARDSVTYTKKKKRHHRKKSSLKNKGYSVGDVKSNYTQKGDSCESADSNRLKKSYSQDSAQYRCLNKSSLLDSSGSRYGKHHHTRHHSKSNYATRSSSNDSAGSGYAKKSHSHDSSRHRHRKASTYDSMESRYPKKCSQHDSIQSRYMNKCSYHSSVDSRHSKTHSYYDSMASRQPKPCSYHNSWESRHRKRHSPLDSMESRYTQKSSYGSNDSTYPRKCSPAASLKSGHSRKC